MVFSKPTTDFTVSSTTLTFGTAPVNADVITIKELVEGQNAFNDNSTETQLQVMVQQLVLQ